MNSFIFKNFSGHSGFERTVNLQENRIYSIIVERWKNTYARRTPEERAGNIEPAGRILCSWNREVGR